jgi:hypothetical protein
VIAARNYPINCGLATSEFSRTFAKRRVADRAFDIDANEIQRVVEPGTVSTVAVKDRAFTRNTSASYVTDFLVNRELRAPQYYQPATFSSSDTAILSNPPLSGTDAGIAAHQSNGRCSLFATALDGEVAAVGVVSSSQTPATVDTPAGWAADSLAQHCTDQIDGRLVGPMPVFLQQDGTTFVRNPACWAAGIDLTCASPWNSTGGLQRAGTLVSPRHVLFCKHFNFHPSVNATIKFVTQANEVVSRTITALATHPEYSSVSHYPDIVVGVLNADVPESIGFAEVLPADWLDYLPSVSRKTPIPALRLNRVESASVADFCVASGGGFGLQFPASNRAGYYERLVSGDSGNPAFLVVDDKPVLLGLFTSGGPGGGTFLTDQIDAVNAMLTDLGGGYSLTPADLSEFPNYGE